MGLFKMYGASQKIVKIMAERPSLNTRGGLVLEGSKVSGELEIKDIEFTYPSKGEVQVCKNISI